MKYNKSVAVAAFSSMICCSSGVSGSYSLFCKAPSDQLKSFLDFFQKNKKSLAVISTVFLILVTAGICWQKWFGSFKCFDYTGKESLNKIKNKLKSGDKLVVDFKKEEGFQKLEDLNVLIERMVENLGQFFVLFEKEGEIDHIAESVSNADTKITLSFVCYDLQDFSKELLKKYESISNLDDLYNYIYFLDNKVSLRFPQCTNSSQESRLFFVSQVFGSAMIDQSYTRNDVSVIDKLCQNMQTMKESFTNGKLEAESSKILTSIAFYKKVIETTLDQTVNERYVINDGSSKKFNVENDPNSSDLIKYILTAKKIKRKGEEESYNKFLEKIVLYIFSSANEISQEERCSEEDTSLRVNRKWNSESEKELFDYFLSIRGGQKIEEVEKGLISFLKKFLSNKELKDIEDNFLKDNKDFKDVFNENIQI